MLFRSLQVGDYPHAYLEEIKARRFPPEMPVDPIRYEAWQPPLYYLLAAPVYRLALGLPAERQVLALRLLSVALGTLLLLACFRTATTLAPDRPWLALGATALVASVPMHIAMTAAVNNDTLAELLGALVLWQLVARLRYPSDRWAPWSLLGTTLGLAGLTKLSTVILVPLALAVLVYHARRQTSACPHLPSLCRPLLSLALPATLLLAPWLARNVAVYGSRDPLALARHASVVQGQLRTADRVAQVGLPRVITDMVVTTFHSFWGQFGWMGVPIDSRLYTGLAIMTALACVGLLLRLFSRPPARPRLARWQAAGIGLLGTSIMLSVIVFLLYNLSFVQYQGRYLFPALIPIGIFAAAGWREITRRQRCWLVAGALIAAAALTVALWLLQLRPLDKWAVALLASGGALFGLAACTPASWPSWLYALPYPLLLILDAVCLYHFILPALG